VIPIGAIFCDYTAGSRGTGFELNPFAAVMKSERVGVCEESKLAFYRGSDSRTTRSSPSKDEHTLHQVIVDLILVKNLASYKLLETACSH
jgi:hypothetical protein